MIFNNIKIESDYNNLDYLRSIKGQRLYATLVADNKEIKCGRVYFSENANWLIGHTCTFVHFNKNEFIKDLQIVVTDINNNVICTASTDDHMLIMGHRDCLISLHFGVCSLVTNNECKLIIPESFEKPFRYNKLLEKALSDYNDYIKIDPENDNEPKYAGAQWPPTGEPQLTIEATFIGEHVKNPYYDPEDPESVEYIPYTDANDLYVAIAAQDTRGPRQIQMLVYYDKLTERNIVTLINASIQDAGGNEVITAEELNSLLSEPLMGESGEDYIRFTGEIPFSAVNIDNDNSVTLRLHGGVPSRAKNIIDTGYEYYLKVAAKQLGEDGNNYKVDLIQSEDSSGVNVSVRYKNEVQFNGFMPFNGATGGYYPDDLNNFVNESCKRLGDYVIFSGDGINFDTIPAYNERPLDVQLINGSGVVDPDDDCCNNSGEDPCDNPCENPCGGDIESGGSCDDCCYSTGGDCCGGGSDDDDTESKKATGYYPALTYSIETVGDFTSTQPIRLSLSNNQSSIIFSRKNDDHYSDREVNSSGYIEYSIYTGGYAQSSYSADTLNSLTFDDGVPVSERIKFTGTVPHSIFETGWNASYNYMYYSHDKQSNFVCSDTSLAIESTVPGAGANDQYVKIWREDNHLHLMVKGPSWDPLFEADTEFTGMDATAVTTYMNESGDSEFLDNPTCCPLTNDLLNTLVDKDSMYNIITNHIKFINVKDADGCIDFFALPTSESNAITIQLSGGEGYNDDAPAYASGVYYNEYFAGSDNIRVDAKYFGRWANDAKVQFDFTNNRDIIITMVNSDNEIIGKSHLLSNDFVGSISGETCNYLQNYAEYDSINDLITITGYARTVQYNSYDPNNFEITLSGGAGANEVQPTYATGSTVYTDGTSVTARAGRKGNIDVEHACDNSGLFAYTLYNSTTVGTCRTNDDFTPVEYTNYYIINYNDVNNIPADSYGVHPLSDYVVYTSGGLEATEAINMNEITDYELKSLSIPITGGFGERKITYAYDTYVGFTCAFNTTDKNYNNGINYMNVSIRHNGDSINVHIESIEHNSSYSDTDEYLFDADIPVTSGRSITLSSDMLNSLFMTGGDTDCDGPEYISITKFCTFNGELELDNGDAVSFSNNYTKPYDSNSVYNNHVGSEHSEQVESGGSSCGSSCESSCGGSCG